ncbi:hypothetical protein A3Q56_00221 [Intoshia linei]|uniref:Eukaryotic translation initiation factor 3 subunit L n=1 Tax=Intoshia linei TaxID=1819745 RepID=A0A177BCH3_9BILA|nr:hypothetical protein A3Q56_00221 [Intoshia linei]
MQSSPIDNTVIEFVRNFQQYILSHNIYEVKECYDKKFVEITNTFFDNVPWPSIESMDNYVNIDTVFSRLYKEIYYRHYYARVEGGPQLDARIDSYNNYINIFQGLLLANDPVDLHLPSIWLWNMVTEFIYQFQAFTQFRYRNIEKTLNKDTSNAWNVHSVIKICVLMCDRANINNQLILLNEGEDRMNAAGKFGCRDIYYELGLFSLIGLLRINCLLADYQHALSYVANIDRIILSTICKVPECIINYYYYVSFCYFMLRRYTEAISYICAAINYEEEQSSTINKGIYNEKKQLVDKMFYILAMSLALNPLQIDESIMHDMKNRLSDRYGKLLAGDLKEFENCFKTSCPKFVSPFIPTDSEMCERTMLPINHQLEFFLNEVIASKTQLMPELRSYIGFYSTIPIKRLSYFMQQPEEKIYQYLMCCKHRANNSQDLENEKKNKAKLDFYIDGDMIHIANTTVSKKTSDIFIRQIKNLEHIQHKLNALKIPPKV